MDVTTIKNQIQNNTLQSFYIFTGPEWEVQKIYIKQISKVRNAEISYIDSISDIIGRIKNRSFVKKDYVYVVRDDKELMQNEKLLNDLPTMLGNDILILLLTTVDKRLKFYKQHGDAIIEFESLSDKILTKYIKQQIDLSDKSCQLLVDICEHDYGRILLEIDKIKQFYNYGIENRFDKLTYDGVLVGMIKDGTIYNPPYDAIWDLIDSILKGKVNETFNLLEQSYAVGEATMVMLSNLYNNAKAVLQVQSCNSKDISKSTGLTGWQIKNAKEHSGYYSNEELINMMRIIQKVETGIKRGLIEEDIAMQYILVNVL